MIRHNFIAALRNMAANKLSTAIAIFGLSIGITSAILMALVIRNQLSIDHFIPGYERTFLGVSKISPPNQAILYMDLTNRDVATLLKLNEPDVESAGRLMPVPDVTLRKGTFSAAETINWADPNLFDVLPLPVYRGDLRNALRQPDSIVLPREIALKYFGRDDVLGQVILVNDHPMTVRAVIDNLPDGGTELQSGIFAAGMASFSALTADRRDAEGWSISVITYVRLKPGQSIAALAGNLPRLMASLLPHNGLFGSATGYVMSLVRLDRIMLFEGLHPGASTRLVFAGLIGLLILFISAINFVNLLTARAARRGQEVGVRKVCGASRATLIKQFLGESVLTVLLATCVAVMLAEWLLPALNAFLSTGAMLDYGRDPRLPVALLLGIVLLGLAAGFYPAFILSAFRPIDVLKGSASLSPGGSKTRNTLVTLQFAVLIGLIIAAVVVYQQQLFATRDGLRANIDRVVIVRAACQPAFRDELRRLPSILAVACTDQRFLDNRRIWTVVYKGEKIPLDIVRADWGTFALYGIKPLAGSLETLSPYGDYNPNAPSAVILNQSAIRRLGFTSPQAAIGQVLPQPTGQGLPAGISTIRIAAVLPDFAFYSMERPMEAVAYVPGPSPLVGDDFVHVKLRGDRIPETLAAIDRLWSATGGIGTIKRSFLDQQIREQNLSITREAQIFAVCAAIAVFLASLGLAGLSIATTERRIKEIGIRKAMGAESHQIVALLLWQFSRPILMANLIAWPVAWWLMRRWLSGFAYHVDLSWWVFAAASVGALLIALATVASQAWLAARRKPVLALRYE